MQNNVNKVISNALLVNKDILADNLKAILKYIKNALVVNEKVIKEANKIDKEKNNGFIMDFSIVKNIFTNIEKDNILYGDVILSQKDENKKIIYGKQVMDRGNVLVITDGNPYIMIELAIRNIMAGNTTIFLNSGYMYGTNQLLIKIIQSVLEKFNISKYLVQICVSEKFDEILSNFSNIDFVVCIGDHNLQRRVLVKNKNQVIVSGYENFDLYVEDEEHIEFVKKIISTGLNIQIYVKDGVNFDFDSAMVVSDIEEAISQVNYNGSRYSSSIFTSSSKNASKFIKEVRSSIVTVNTSPMIERLIDIKQKDLVCEKTIIYPCDFNFDGSNSEVKIEVKS